MPGRKKQRRACKDSVFVDLFARCPEAKENFLSLYNAMHGTKLAAADTDVEPVMLEQTIYTGRYNDVAMLVDGKVIVLAEQQSTINENMPVRFLEYIGRLYEKLIPEEKRYRQKLIRLPRPEFYVFYNGEADCPAEKTMCLASAFSSGGGGVKAMDSPLELSVKVYNINRRDEIPFVADCAPLSGYSRLVEYAREAKKAGVDGWLDYAVQKCIKEGVLANYLKRNSTEVRNMLFGEYDYEADIREKRQESYEEGYSSGITQGISQGISQEAARQKAEDEKLFALKDAGNAQQAEEIQRQAQRIAELEAMLAKR